MCRWFAYISPGQKFLLEDALVLPDHALSKQPKNRYDPDLYQPDSAAMKDRTYRNWFFSVHGLGVAWYSPARNAFEKVPTTVRTHSSEKEPSYPVVYKSLTPPVADQSFRSICAGVRTNACFGHIRAAVPSPGAPIPNISENNCHPFTYGRYSLMHNGGIANYGVVQKHMVQLIREDQLKWIRGTSDTETFAALFFTYLPEEEARVAREEEEVAEGERRKSEATCIAALSAALKRTIEKVFEIQKEVLRKGLEAKLATDDLSVAVIAEELKVTLASRKVTAANLKTDDSYKELTQDEQQAELREKFKSMGSNLNIAITDGCILVCCRLRNHDTQQPPSLYYSTTAGATLHHDDDMGLLDPPADGTYVIVASEQTTRNRGEWIPIQNNTSVTFDGKVVNTAPLGIQL